MDGRLKYLQINSKFAACREAATPEQLSELAQTLYRLDIDCQIILDLVRVMYGAEDNRSTRAEELCNNLQRFQWSLDRGNSQSNSGLVHSNNRQGG